MADAGYSEVETEEIKSEVDHYEKVRQEVKLASGFPAFLLNGERRLALQLTKCVSEG